MIGILLREPDLRFIFKYAQNLARKSGRIGYRRGHTVQRRVHRPRSACKARVIDRKRPHAHIATVDRILGAHRLLGLTPQFRRSGKKSVITAGIAGIIVNAQRPRRFGLQRVQFFKICAHERRGLAIVPLEKALDERHHF